MIDHGALEFARAAARTMREQWPHVAALAATGALEDGSGGNIVLVASHAPLDLEQQRRELSTRGLAWEVTAGTALDRFVRDAPVLSDDFAPVDQLLTPYPTA